MDFELKGVHFHVSENSKEYINNKLHTLDKFESGIEHLHITIKQETPDLITTSADIHFHWKHLSHISHSDKDLHACIDYLFEELVTKCRREKEKTKDHRQRDHSKRI